MTVLLSTVRARCKRKGLIVRVEEGAAAVYADHDHVDSGRDALERIEIATWTVVALDPKRLILAEETRYSAADAESLREWYRGHFPGDTTIEIEKPRIGRGL